MSSSRLARLPLHLQTSLFSTLKHPPTSIIRFKTTKCLPSHAPKPLQNPIARNATSSAQFTRLYFRERIYPDIIKTSWFLFLFVAYGLPLLIFFNHHVIRFEVINGPSMFPFLNGNWDESLERDIVIIWKWNMGKREDENGKKGWKRGEVVALWSPSHPETRIIKRIVGLPGDIVTTAAPYPEATCQVPAGHIWIEGDGRHFGKLSLDSNYYGPVSETLVLGRLVWVLWPWNKAGRVEALEGWRGKTKVVVGKGVGEFRWA